MSKQKNKEPWQDPLSGGVADNRAYRQFVANSSKTNADNLAVAFGQFNEAKAVAAGQTKDDLAELQRYKAAEAEKKGSVGIRTARVLLFVVALFTGLFLRMIPGAEGGLLPIIWAVFMVSAVAWLALLILPKIIKRK